jgi:hypothetical protein
LKDGAPEKLKKELEKIKDMYKPSKDGKPKPI